MPTDTLPEYLSMLPVALPGSPASAPAALPPPAGITANDQTARFLALRDELLASLRPFMTGAPGSSPLADATIAAFKAKALPVIQQQGVLQGLNYSPAIPQMTADALAQAMPQVISADLTNRLTATGQAANLIPAENQIFDTQATVGTNAAKLISDIANNEATRNIAAFNTAGNLSLGSIDAYAKAAQLSQNQQQLALQAAAGGGQLQQDVAQGALDAIQAERLRLQGLSEGATTGLFGGSVLPPTLQSTTKGKTSSSK